MIVIVAQIRIAAGAGRIFVSISALGFAFVRVAAGSVLVFTGALGTAIAVALPALIARSFRGFDLPVEKRVADHLDSSALIAASGAYLSERSVCGDDAFDLLQRL